MGAMVTAIAALAAAVLGSIIGPWIQTLWIEPRAKTNQKMLDGFQVFITNIEGFYQGSIDEKKIREVCLQYRMAWLYASDNVIKAINQWFTAQGSKSPTEGSLEWTTALMVSQMRREVHPKTTLRASDYLTPYPLSRRH